MDRNKPNQSRRRGAALLLVLSAVVILSIMGVGLLMLGLQARIRAIRQGKHIQARCAADAGLVHAVFSMNQRLNSKIDLSNEASFPRAMEEPLASSSAIFSYKITANSLKTNREEYAVTSIGKSDEAQKTVYATIRLKGLFESAILGRSRISLMPNTLVSGYNSADPTDTDIDLQIGTTSTVADSIPLGPGTVVDGDVFVGMGGDPQTVIGAGGTVTGEKYALTEDIDFTVIVPPTLQDMGVALDAKGATITLGPEKSGRYTDISLSQSAGSSGVLEIAGGDVTLHITGNIDLGNGCEVLIRPGSSLTLYVDGDIHTDNSVGFNNETASVKCLEIYATGQDNQVFDLKAKSSVFGVIYAPEADISIYPGSEIRGAIVGENVTFKSGCKFYYDEAARYVTVEDEGARFVVTRWRDL